MIAKFRYLVFYRKKVWLNLDIESNIGKFVHLRDFRINKQKSLKWVNTRISVFWAQNKRINTWVKRQVMYDSQKAYKPESTEVLLNNE